MWPNQNDYLKKFFTSILSQSKQQELIEVNSVEMYLTVKLICLLMK